MVAEILHVRLLVGCAMVSCETGTQSQVSSLWEHMTNSAEHEPVGTAGIADR